MLTPTIEKKSGHTTAVTPLSSTQTVSVAVFVNAGSRHESFEKNGGVSHFLEHLLFKGTEKRPHSRMIAEAIESIGGYHNAATSYEYTYYYVKVPKQHLETAIDILSDIIQNPVFDSDEIERERGVIIEEMHMRRDDPSQYVSILVPKLLWPQSNYANDIIGTNELITSMSREEITNYHETHYHKNNAAISIAGNVDPYEANKLVEKYFNMNGSDKELSNLEEDMTMSEERTIALKQDTKQAHVNIATQGYSLRHEQRHALKVLMAVLGNGSSSRLFMNIRERLGLVYSIAAGSSAFTDSGEVGIYAGINPESVPKALEAIFDELETIRTNEISDSELASAKEKLIGNSQMRYENTMTVASSYGSQLVLTDEIEPLLEYHDKIRGVTKSDVLTAAQELLTPKRMRMGIISSNPDSAVETFEKLSK